MEVSKDTWDSDNTSGDLPPREPSSEGKVIDRHLNDDGGVDTYPGHMGV